MNTRSTSWPAPEDFGEENMAPAPVTGAVSEQTQESTIATAGITTGNASALTPMGSGIVRRTRRPALDEERPVRRSTDFAELSEQVKEAGLLRRRRVYYWSKFWLITIALALLVVLFIRGGNSWWQMPLAGVFAVAFTQAAFLGHDAAHRQVFQSGQWNNWASLVIGNLFVGMSVGWWNNKHTRHHANPNRIGYDPDLDIPVVQPGGLTLLRERSRLVRWTLDHQSIGFFPFLFFQGLILHISSFRRVFGRTSIPHRSVEISLMLARLGGFIGLTFLVLSPGRAGTFLGIEFAVFGFYLGAVFAINHMGMPLVSKSQKLDFFRRQVLTGRNIRGGQLTSFTMGGLNYQIEHHLFPSMARSQLRHAAPLVRAFCQERNVAYTETGVRQAFRSVTDYIDNVGLGHQDPFECPMIAQRQTATPVGCAT